MTGLEIALVGVIGVLVVALAISIRAYRVYKQALELVINSALDGTLVVKPLEEAEIVNFPPPDKSRMH